MHLWNVNFLNGLLFLSEVFFQAVISRSHELQPVINAVFIAFHSGARGDHVLWPMKGPRSPVCLKWHWYCYSFLWLNCWTSLSAEWCRLEELNCGGSGQNSRPSVIYAIKTLMNFSCKTVLLMHLTCCDEAWATKGKVCENSAICDASHLELINRSWFRRSWPVEKLYVASVLECCRPVYDNCTGKVKYRRNSFFFTGTLSVWLKDTKSKSFFPLERVAEVACRCCFLYWFCYISACCRAKSSTQSLWQTKGVHLSLASWFFVWLWW